MADVTGKNSRNLPQNPSRRAALRRLAGAVVAAYVVPEVVFLSEARAASSGSVPSPASGTSGASPPSTPSTPPSKPSASGPSEPSASGPSLGGSGPSVGEDEDADEKLSDTCITTDGADNNTISISRSDLARSQEAVEAGFAQPLNQIWQGFRENYDGKIIGVEFTGRRINPRYRFRAISPRGRLETVIISAQTGEIIRIVGC